MSLNYNNDNAESYNQSGATAYLIDPAGTYRNAGASAPTIDPPGTYSGAGASAPTPADAGTYILLSWATSEATEIVDPTGGASAATIDPAGFYSGVGLSETTPVAVTYVPGARATSSSAEIVEASGTYSGAGASAATSHPVGGTTSAAAETVDPGGTSSAAGASTQAVDLTATSSDLPASAPALNPKGTPPGYYCQAGATAYLKDPAGTYSFAGASAPTPAAAGTYIPVTRATSAAAEIVSPAGTYRPAGASAPIADPGGTYSAAGASAPTTDPAGTYSSPYALDRLILSPDNNLSPYEVLSFNSETAVTNYFGATSEEASLATEFFAGYGSSATLLYTRYPVEGSRAHLFGSNISNMTLAELRTINGSLSITSQGYAFSGSVNLSGVESFPAAATAIRNALNANLPVAAITTGSSIAPVSVSFTGSQEGASATSGLALLDVTAISSGSIQIGGFVSGAGITPEQVYSQVSGTPGGVGVYNIYTGTGAASSEAMTETYGVLTVGSTRSGTVADGQMVTDVTGEVLPYTAIESNLSGSGAGSTWLVNKTQTVVRENMTMTGAPLSVTYTAKTGATANRDYFEIQQNGNFAFDSASLSYAAGTTAGSLGLTQASGAFDSSPGEIVTNPSAWMNNLVQNETDQFGSFETMWPQLVEEAPETQEALEAWAQSTGGRYNFLAANILPNATTPAGSSAPTRDPAGTYSGPGASAPTPAAAGTYIPVTGATSAAAEILDPAGAYSLAGASAPTLAQPGYYVPTTGASSETPDSPGYYTPLPGATAELLAQPPTISGTVAGQSTASGQPDTPFSFVTIADPNIHTSDSLSIQLTGGGGTLADGGGFNGLMTSGGVYTLSGTAAAITHELDALVFSPNTFGATTTFTLTDTTSVGTSKTDAKTTVTVTNGKPVVASVSRFLADKSKLDQTPGGFDILDGAAGITANLDQLNDQHIDEIIVSNNRNVVSSVQQLTTDAMAIDKLQNANHSPARLAINDTAADVQAGLSTLVADTGEFASITASNGPIVVSAATFVDDQSALDKIVGGFAVADIAANIAANLSQLNDSNISQITISDNGQISASVARFTSDATAIGDLRNANALPVKLAINDTAGAVQTGLSTLVADTGAIGSITTSFGPIVVSAATFKADRSTLDKIKGGFDVSDTAANLVADLPILNADSLNADSGVAGITAAIGGATLSGGPVNAPSFSESGWGTNLTVNEALAYAGAFSQGLGFDDYSISNGDHAFADRNGEPERDNERGGGTLALGGGSATIAHGATISVSNWSISGAGTDVTLDENLNYTGSFSEGAGDTFVLSGGHLLLSGAAIFAGGTVDGSKLLYTEGTTTVSGLTIGGTVEWENINTVNQSGGNVTLGDNIPADEAILFNTSVATYDILDDSGIGLGASMASFIKNTGLFEKTGGTGTSVIAPAVTNTGTIEVTGATLDMQGVVAGTGADEISGSSTLEFDSTVAAGQTVSFTGSGELALSDPAAFAGRIGGFDTVGANGAIEVAGPWVFSGFKEKAAGTQGALEFANGASTISLILLGNYNPADFVHQTQANGSTLITYTGVELNYLLRPVPGAETHAGEFGIREASRNARGDWGAGASWDGSVGHGPGPS